MLNRFDNRHYHCEGPGKKRHQRVNCGWRYKLSLLISFNTCFASFPSFSSLSKTYGNVLADTLILESKYLLHDFHFFPQRQKGLKESIVLSLSLLKSDFKNADV